MRYLLALLATLLIGCADPNVGTYVGASEVYGPDGNSSPLMNLVMVTVAASGTGYTLDLGSLCTLNATPGSPSNVITPVQTCVINEPNGGTFAVTSGSFSVNDTDGMLLLVRFSGSMGNLIVLSFNGLRRCGSPSSSPPRCTG